MTELALRTADAFRTRLRGLDRVWLLIAAVALATALLAPAQAPAVFDIAVGSFLATLPFIAVAVGLVAWLKATGAEAIVARAFQGREIRMIVLAAIAGMQETAPAVRKAMAAPGLMPWATRAATSGGAAYPLR